jgi:hypothetical protein
MSKATIKDWEDWRANWKKRMPKVPAPNNEKD